MYYSRHRQAHNHCGPYLRLECLLFMSLSYHRQITKVLMHRLASKVQSGLPSMLPDGLQVCMLHKRLHSCHSSVSSTILQLATNSWNKLVVCWTTLVQASAQMRIQRLNNCKHQCVVVYTLGKSSQLWIESTRDGPNAQKRVARSLWQQAHNENISAMATN